MPSLSFVKRTANLLKATFLELENVEHEITSLPVLVELDIARQTFHVDLMLKASF